MLNFTTYTTTSQNISFSANPNKLKIRKKDLETLSQTKTVKEIAEIYHTQTQWLYVLYKRFELQPPQKQLHEKVESIIIELLRKKPSLSYICEKTGASADLVRKILKEIILDGIPIIECPANPIGGYVHIETNKDLGHFDFVTNNLINQYKESLIKNIKSSQPAWKCAQMAAEAVNQMTQYFCNIRYASVDTTLNIDMYHHKYTQKDRFGEF